jgi:ATP-dependent phosphoenolpyruvate carboxykinase
MLSRILTINRHLRRFSTLNVPQLVELGIKNNKIKYNLSYEQLFTDEVNNKEGNIFKTDYGDTFGVDTGKFTGRSPNDKWVVKNINSESNKYLWWGNVNKPIEPYIFDELLNKAVDHFNNLDSFYLYDGLCGANKKTQKRVRFVHEQAWQQHFVKNMFIELEDKLNFPEVIEPDFTIINACSVVNDKWKEHNLNSEVAVAFNIEKKLGVILGTWYGGENKKGIFSLMNYWLPMNNIMAMHCSANVGKEGDTALFFGLSGTGKTTLSADPNRKLIGDDEHGWDEDGIFNFEGGCYAKTINLKEENEPEIYRAIRKNALLENVWINDDNTPDYKNVTKTQNGRVSYPITHIKNVHNSQCAEHPNNIIFLTCDAFGVLPPVSRLSTGQAMYHFLSGYTAKIAGTERGVTEPEATFSACFGEAFLTLHPTKYAELLEKKMNEHNCTAYLVNTGWSGGAYGVGNRMSIQTTRKCINSILSGSINNCEFRTDDLFQFEVPITIEDIPIEICNPRESWNDKESYDNQAIKLANMFRENFKKYKKDGFIDYSEYGPMV